MASIKLYLDTRKKKEDGTYPLKVSVTRNYVRVMLPLNIDLFVDQFDPKGGRDGHSWVAGKNNSSFVNRFISRRLVELDEAMYDLERNGELQNITAKELKQALLHHIHPEESENGSVYVKEVFNEFMQAKKGRTNAIYFETYKKLAAFADINALTFAEIDARWLKRFETWLNSTISVNTTAIHLRNLRAVFNYAIDEELITAYPFRKFKIKREATAKRSLTIDQLKQLISYPCEDRQVYYRDIFLLNFMLIGINMVDLCHAKKKAVVNGRLEYRRSKTKKLYSIKIEPEAQELINKYAGKTYLIDVMERYKNHEDFTHRLNENLQNIGECTISKYGKKTRVPLFPEITTYWARHTWATIAHHIGIPKDVISMSLGHTLDGAKVTDTYIDYDREKIDDANRKVISFVFAK